MYTFNFSEQQINVILRALGAQPYEMSAPMITEIHKQVQASKEPKIVVEKD